MRKYAVFCTLAALLGLATAPTTVGKSQSGPSAPTGVPASQPAAAGKGGELATLEQKLLGTWQGGPCVGDYTFNADGTYELRNFTPGVNTLTGAWSLRWDALPPTLVVTCKTSDFRKRDTGRREYEYFGKSLEAKVEELTADALVLRFPADPAAGFPKANSERYERPAEE